MPNDPTPADPGDPTGSRSWTSYDADGRKVASGPGPFPTAVPESDPRAVTTFVYDLRDLPAPDPRDRTTYVIDPSAVPGDAGSAVTQWWSVYDAEGHRLASGTGPHPGFGEPDPRDDDTLPDEPHIVE